MTRKKPKKPIIAETDTFHRRFQIDVADKETQRRFLNRIRNKFFNIFFVLHKDELPFEQWWYEWVVADELGEEYKSYYHFDDYIKNDFYRCLQALERIYAHLVDADTMNKSDSLKKSFNTTIQLVIEKSEVDLGITWKDGRFYPSGAEELDQELVNEPLKWLREKKYKSIMEPYSKGLSHYLQSIKKTELLSDVVTDMYEALEALAKIVTKRTTKDLSANRELFIKNLGASEAYKRILNEYIKYANEYRHATKEEKKRPNLIRSEVESFIYLTGIFLRLAIQLDRNNEK
jgi:hypothetical protein